MNRSLSTSSQEPLVAARGSGIFRFASPQTFYPLAGHLVPWFGLLAVLLAAAGLYVGFFVAPTDAQQGEVYRVIFIHVPAAWMSMFLYVVMAFWAAVGLAFNTRLSGMMASAIAPTGALFTFIALWTGSLWGKPTWGTWWVWDARLTSELILLFLYFGFLGLHAAIDDWRRADRACAVLALVGVVNIPIIYFSVQWWNTLHQGASISFSKAPTMAATMLTGMLLMAFACWMYSIAVSLVRVRAIILERERRADWVREYVQNEGREGVRA
jgi:heme exporter protein C